ncbi:MAG: hypothetical protein IJU71_13295 [Selenomonadaceae bacterium]|nr:hypothetical protein [Selenomonadaceae bacterium]
MKTIKQENVRTMPESVRITEDKVRMSRELADKMNKELATCMMAHGSHSAHSSR